VRLVRDKLSFVHIKDGDIHSRECDEQEQAQAPPWHFVPVEHKEGGLRE
jgi:hypothetical protein